MKNKKSYTLSDETIKLMKEIEEKTMLSKVKIIEIAVFGLHEMITREGYDLTKLKMKI
jgi:hypothetical protein